MAYLSICCIVTHKTFVGYRLDRVSCIKKNIVTVKASKLVSINILYMVKLLTAHNGKETMTTAFAGMTRIRKLW